MKKLLKSKAGRAGIAVIAIVVLAAAWFLFSPLLIDETVDEAFPGVPTPDALAAMSDEDKDKIEADVLAAAATMPDKSMADDMPAASAGQPVLLAQGQFRDTDALHKGSGNAGLYQLAAGDYVVRLEDLNVTNGPDLRLVLAKHPEPTASGDIKEDYVDLGALKGNIGNQNYEVPADFPSAQSISLSKENWNSISDLKK